MELKKVNDVRIAIALTVLCILPSRGILKTDWMALLISGALLLKDKDYRISKIWMSGGAVAYFITQIFFLVFRLEGINSILQFFMVFVLVPLTIFRRLNTEDKIRKYLQGLVFLFSIYSIIGIFESFTGINIFELLYGYQIERFAANEIRFGLYRSFGLCTVSINNAMLMNIIWCIANYLLCENKKKKTLIIEWGIIGVYTILILSKAVMIVAVLSQIVLFMRNMNEGITAKGVFKFTLLIVAVVVILNSNLVIVKYARNIYIPIINQLLGTSFAYDDTFSAGGFGERFQLVSWVIEELDNKWLFGVGYQQKFSHSFIKISASGNSSTWYKESIENTWLYYLYRTGCVGLIGFMMYQFDCIKKTLKLIKKEVKRNSMSFLMMVVSVAYFFLILMCFAQEDLRLYFVLMAVYSAHIQNIRNINIINRKETTKNVF